MDSPVLLAAFAHPDDEAFGSGGTLARSAAAQVAVSLVCATRGEVGEISDPALATPATLGAVREDELRCAAQALGIGDIIFLDYRDSGMAGTADNTHPQAFVQAAADAIVPQLVALIRRLKPQVVLTFDPEGGYGHPDHIAIHHHTVAAFHAASDAAQYPEAGAPWQPQRLFYPVFPRATFQAMGVAMKDAGVDAATLTRFAERGWPDDAIDVVIDVTATVEAKWAALRCHQTQFGPDNPFRRIPEATAKALMRREYFVQAWPAPQGTPRHDLFEGL